MKQVKRQIPLWWLPVAFAAGILLGCLITNEFHRNKDIPAAATENSVISEGASGAQTGSGDLTGSAASDAEASGSLAAPPLETTGMTASSDPQASSDTLTASGKSMASGEPAASGKSTASGESAAAAKPAGAYGNAVQWDQAAVYTGGDLVLFQGKYYKAKWWTQNETPGKTDVWEDTGEAPAAEGSTSGNAAGNQYKVDGNDRNTALPAPDRDAAAGDFRIVAYYPSWTSGDFYKGTSISEKVQFDKITHLYYAFAIPTAEGSLLPLENESMARELIKTAHEYGVKVMLAVGGWSYNDTPLESTFGTATENAQKLEKFASSILDMCQAYGFDGIDLDWEHPRVDGGSGKQYEALVELLADKLHKEGLLLSCAVLSGATADGNIYYDAAAHTDRVLAAVDWINIMAYDGGDGERHSTYDFAVSCAEYWRDTRSMPAHKINLGVPFYSRPGWASYDALLEQDPEAWSHDVTTYNGMEAWYNGMDTIRSKTQYARQQLGGIMIWEITQDTADREKSLLTAIWEAAN